MDRGAPGSSPLRPARKGRGERGQSLTEFTLVAPLLLILFIGFADFGRVFNAGIVTEAAARDAAEVGAQDYLIDPPGPLSAPPVPPPGYYQALHAKAAAVVCAETRGLPDSTYQTSDGSCPGMPFMLVCVHDGADDACGLEPYGAALPAECPSLTSPPTNTQTGGSENSRYVEVRVCYRFATLIRLPFLPLGDFWLERARTFTVANY